MVNHPKSAFATLLLSACLLTACGSTEGMKQRKTDEEVACSFAFGNRNLSWRPVLNIPAIGLEPHIGNANLPSKFEAYVIDGAGLDAFLKAAKAGQPEAGILRFPLPEDAGCPAFTLSASETMSEALSKKFPDLISLKGLPEENKTAALRLDYDGKKMEAEITWEGHIYYLSPWPGKNGIYYLLYKKEDAGFEKKPFHPY